LPAHTSVEKGIQGIGLLRPISDPAVPAYTRLVLTGGARRSGNRTTGGDVS